MTTAEALNILAQRDEYEQKYQLSSPTFVGEPDRLTVFFRHGPFASVSFQTRGELSAFCNGYRLAAPATDEQSKIA